MIKLQPVHRMHGQVPQGHAYRLDQALQAHLTIKGNVALPSRQVPQGHAYRLDRALQAHLTIEGNVALPSLPPLPCTGTPSPTPRITSYRGKEIATLARNKTNRTSTRTSTPTGQTGDINRVHMTPIEGRIVEGEAPAIFSIDTMGTQIKRAMAMARIVLPSVHTACSAT